MLTESNAGYTAPEHRGDWRGLGLIALCCPDVTMYSRSLWKSSDVLIINRSLGRSLGPLR